MVLLGKEQETIGIYLPERQVATFAPTEIEARPDLSPLLKSSGAAIELRRGARGFTSPVRSDGIKPGFASRFLERV